MMPPPITICEKFYSWSSRFGYCRVGESFREEMKQQQKKKIDENDRITVPRVAYLTLQNVRDFIDEYGIGFDGTP